MARSAKSRSTRIAQKATVRPPYYVVGIIQDRRNSQARRGSAVGWLCEVCGVDCSNNPHFHHVFGRKTGNNGPEHLELRCRDCELLAHKKWSRNRGNVPFEARPAKIKQIYQAMAKHKTRKTYLQPGFHKFGEYSLITHTVTATQPYHARVATTA